MAKPKVTILVALNEKPAIQGLQILTRKFKSSATAWNQSLELLGKAWGAVSGGINLATNTMTKWVAAQSEAEKAERKLIAALGDHEAIGARRLEQLQAFNSAMQQRLGVSGDELLATQASMAALGVHSDKLEDATKAALGLAEATGTDLTSAAKTVAKVFNGNTDMLGRYGIKVKDAADAQRVLVDMFRLAEAQGTTLESRVRVLTENWGDLEEALGKSLTNSKELKTGIDALSEGLLDLINLFSGEKGVKIMDAFFGAFRTGIADMIDALLGAKRAVADFMGSSSMLGRLGSAARVSPLTGSIPRLLSGVTSPESFLNDLKNVLGIGTRVFPMEEEGELGGALEELAGRLRAPSAYGGAAAATGRRRGGGGGGAGSAKPGATHSFPDAFGDVGRMDARTGEAMSAGIGEALADYRSELASEMDVIRIQQQTAALEIANALPNAFLEAGAATTGAIGGYFAGMVESIASGSTSVLDGMRGFLGSILSMMGTYLIQIGTTAVLAGTIGTLIPGLGALIGGPPAVGAGLAAIAAGTAMVAGGTLFGGATSTPSAPRAAAAASSRRASAGPSGGSIGAPAGFGPSQRPVVINVYGGSPRRFARELNDILAEGAY